ncbi:MAG: deoxyguanosinetriphosphate triphosphohydrolase [Devosiaceae bacterium]
MTDSLQDLSAPYAARASDGGQRLINETETPGRSPFRRDRDRIVHAQAFRRLAHKTQVFITEEGDHYRTRLTHTIEVAQIARSLARYLSLDSDLTEALALAHDLGHTPFGHTGEDALAVCMTPYGGFEHNAQTLRIVTKLEQRYAAFDGLNLTREALTGIIKHNGPVLDADGNVRDAKLGGTLPFALTDFMENEGLSAGSLTLDQHGSLEAQVAAISDDIAYNTHDIDDGVRAGFFTLDTLAHVPLVAGILREIDQQFPSLVAERRMGEFSRRLITHLIMDVEAQARQKISDLGIETTKDVREAGQTLAVFSDHVAQDVWMIKTFLFKTMYHNAEIMALRAQADSVLRALFGHFLASPKELPADWQVANDTSMPDAARARVVCDFIAGMTDRYALKLHTRLFDDTPDLRYGAAI